MKKILFYCLIIATLFSGAFSAHAATGKDYKLLEPLPCIQGTGTICAPQSSITSISIEGYVGYIFKFTLALAVFLATVMIIFGGFQWMLSEALEKKTAGKERIKNAVYGLIGVLISYLVLQTIDPRLVQISTSIPPVCDPAHPIPGSICDIKVSANFASQLETDLKALDAQNLKTVGDQQVQINKLSEQISEIQNEIEYGSGDITAEKFRLQQLMDQRRALQTAQVQTIATGSSENYFRQAINGLHKADAFDASGNIIEHNNVAGADAQTNAAAQKLNITKVYNNLKNDPSIINNTTAKDSLNFQEQFYWHEIDAEQEFMSQVTKLKNTPAETIKPRQQTGSGYTPGSLTFITNPEYTKQVDAANKTLASYELQTNYLNAANTNTDDFKAINSDPALSARLAGIKKDPILTTQYKTLLSDRANGLNTALTPKK